MDSLTTEIIGDIHITVCKTSEDDKLFFVHASNDDISPVRDVIEDTLNKY